jgi:hypothetical protein
MSDGLVYPSSIYMVHELESIRATRAASHYVSGPVSLKRGKVPWKSDR